MEVEEKLGPVGKRFGSRVVLELVETKWFKRSKDPSYIVRCDCGTVEQRQFASIMSRDSCGWCDGKGNALVTTSRPREKKIERTAALLSIPRWWWDDPGKFNALIKYFHPLTLEDCALVFGRTIGMPILPAKRGGKRTLVSEIVSACKPFTPAQCGVYTCVGSRLVYARIPDWDDWPRYDKLWHSRVAKRLRTFWMTRERIRQIETKAFQKIRRKINQFESDNNYKLSVYDELELLSW